VFVAIKDIREGAELTIDYHPDLGIPTKGKGKGKGKRKRRGSDGCMCDAKVCRGMRP
jgi:SET domain-containing protein